MKKIGAVMLAGAMACTMAVGLSACGGAKVKPDFVMPEGGFDINSDVTISFYHTMGDTGTPSLQAVLNAYIEEFNKLYPKIHIEHEQVGGYDDVRDQIQTQIIAGNQPNIAYCYPDHVALYNDALAVESLNNFLPGGAYADTEITRADGTKEKLGLTQAEIDNFIEGYWQEGFEFGDGTKMYTVPFSKSTEVLYYNVTEFNKHGWEAPKTWEELGDLCEKIKQEYPDTPGEDEGTLIHVYPFGYDSEANWFITMCEQMGTPYTSAEGEHYLFDTPENRAFVAQFKEWFEEGYFLTQGTNGGSYTSGLFINTDKSMNSALMCIGSSAGASHQSPYDSESDYYPFEVGIAPIPQYKQTVDSSREDYQADYKDKAISQGPSVCIFKSDDPQKVIASWLFIKFLITNVNFQAEFSSASGYIPVLKQEVMETNATFKNKLLSANGFENLPALSTKIAMQMEDAYYTSPAFVGSSTARDQVGSLMQAVFGSTSVEQAFKNAIEECKYFG